MSGQQVYEMPLEMVRWHPSLVLELMSVAQGGLPTGYRDARLVPESEGVPEAPVVEVTAANGERIRVCLRFPRECDGRGAADGGLLMVVCFDEEVAEGFRHGLETVVVGPRDLRRWYSLEKIAESPELATLWAIACGDSEVRACVAKALLVLRDERGAHYYSYLSSRLPAPDRARLENLLMGERYLLIENAVTSPFWDAGRWQGRRETLRWLLDHRGLKVDRFQDEVIDSCRRQATVREWMRRALTASTSDDVFTGYYREDARVRAGEEPDPCGTGQG
ncbi:hypothetical protein ACIBEJ_26195 [Nonomuraea sp. NPDC050790]|uniref:hypothetical protein n=1 Tax=Nonomuraea sp. NPDC050790 TaxID=3364371 RepID=UPI0037A12673